jgi:hypothetical protein
MSRKNTLVYPVLTNQSLSASFISPVTFVQYMDNCSYQINITTTNSMGSFAVQCSNDYAINDGAGNVVTNVGNWFALTLAGGTPSANAANDTIGINLNQLPFKAMRLVYTSTTAGTGTCSVYVVDKMIGG